MCNHAVFIMSSSSMGIVLKSHMQLMHFPQSGLLHTSHRDLTSLQQRDSRFLCFLDFIFGKLIASGFVDCILSESDPELAINITKSEPGFLYLFLSAITRLPPAIFSAFTGLEGTFA